MKRNHDSLKEPKPGAKDWNEALDWAFSREVYPKLVRKYPNQWVAIVHQRIIASGKDLMEVLKKAQRKAARRDIPHLFVERGIHVYTHEHSA